MVRNTCDFNTIYLNFWVKNLICLNSAWHVHSGKVIFKQKKFKVIIIIILMSDESSTVFFTHAPVAANKRRCASVTQIQEPMKKQRDVRAAVSEDPGRERAELLPDECGAPSLTKAAHERACVRVRSFQIILIIFIADCEWLIDLYIMSVLEEYERAPKRLKVSAEDEEELEEGEESDSASAGLMGDDEEDEGQSRARWSSADRKVRPQSLYSWISIDVMLINISYAFRFVVLHWHDV